MCGRNKSEQTGNVLRGPLPPLHSPSAEELLLYLGKKKINFFFFLFLQLSGLHSSDVCTGVTLDTNHTPNSHFMLLEIKSPVWPVWASSAHMLFQQIEKSDVRPVHVRVCARRRKPMFQCHSLTDPHTMMEGKR